MRRPQPQPRIDPTAPSTTRLRPRTVPHELLEKSGVPTATVRRSVWCPSAKVVLPFLQGDGCGTQLFECSAAGQLLAHADSATAFDPDGSERVWSCRDGRGRAVWPGCPGFSASDPPRQHRRGRGRLSLRATTSCRRRRLQHRRIRIHSRGAVPFPRRLRTAD